MDERLVAALELHRDDPAPVLSFDVPVDYLMNSSHCGQLSTKLREMGGAWETRRATPRLWEQLPRSSGLYMFVWRPAFTLSLAAEERPVTFEWVLYVGKAGDARSGGTLRSRYKGEYARYVEGDPAILWEPGRPKNRQGRLRRYLAVRPLEFWYTEVDDPSAILMIERRLLRLLSPPLNKQGVVTARAGKPVRAFG